MISERNNKKILKIIILSIVILLLNLLITNVNARKLENNIEVEPEKNLIYYLDILYDGVDASKLESSNSVMTDVYSNYIYVEDKIPEGLEFVRICNN